MMLEPLPWWRILAPLTVFVLIALVRSLFKLPRIEIIWRTSLAVVGYAMLQDQISARLSSAYFTIGHPPIPGLSEPTLLGLSWGFLGGFPGGILLGLALALAATVGPAPHISPSSLHWPLLLIILGMAFASISTGISTAYNATIVDISLGEPWSSLVPLTQHRTFFIVACTHFGTYIGGSICGVIACGWLLWHRRHHDRVIATI